jgi:RNA polymerase sigma factor (sigma-70 family)
VSLHFIPAVSVKKSDTNFPIFDDTNFRQLHCRHPGRPARYRCKKIRHHTRLAELYRGGQLPVEWSHNVVKGPSSPILHLIRRAVGDRGLRDLPDQELLQQFHGQGDQAAFHALLSRHGPMVLDVCRSVLGNDADTEDAFQATFLVLARKAGSIRTTVSVGSWLHGVARRTALKARSQSATRRKHEARAPVRHASEADDLSWREVRQVLHEELNGLSECYRAPLVLCYLEGATQEATALQLGLPRGTLRERLERGRGLLRTRLVRRGLGPAALLAAAAWPTANASAGTPPSLTASTIKAASLFAAGQAVTGAVSAKVAALSEGVMKAMFLSKLKIATALVVAVCLLSFGGGLFSLALQAKGQPPATQNQNPAQQPPAEAPAKPQGPPTAAPAPAAKGPAANPAIADTARGRVEFVGLTRQTAAEVLKRAAEAAPDGKLQLCAPCLKSAGFADVAPAFFIGDDGKTVYTVVTVVEKEDAARVRYRPAPPEADAVPIPGWADGLPAARDLMLIQAAVQTYGHFLDGRPEKGRDVAKQIVEDPAKVAAVWEFLKARARPADRDLAAWAVAQHGDPAHRCLAAAILMNFPDSDLTWWLLADAQRDPNGIVSSTAMQALGVLARHRPRAVDWGPAAPTLRALLAGTNPSAYLATLDLLVATKASPDLAPVLLAESDLLRAYLKAEHEPSRAKAEAFARQLGATDVKDAAGWGAWLDRFRPKTEGPGR